jgi:hypothetical protein
MMIDLETVGDFTEWIYSRPATYRHQFQKSERAGYVFDRINLKNHTADVYEINTSKDVRSGGEIRANLTKSVESLGGLPTRMLEPVTPKCERHWRQVFGVFATDEQHRQGDLVVGRRLLAYLSVIRFGEFATFAQVMGHADHLAEGVVNFVSQKFVELATQELGTVSGKTIAILGAAFKPDSDDIRDSPALDIALALSQNGANVQLHDPVALPQVREKNLPVNAIDNIEDVFVNADLVLHLTEWPIYRELDPKKLGEKVTARKIIDGRNCLDLELWSNAGWQVTYLGKPGSPK